jgi:tetratricopeptide (TPR) repeat protein
VASLQTVAAAAGTRIRRSPAFKAGLALQSAGIQRAACGRITIVLERLVLFALLLIPGWIQDPQELPAALRRGIELAQQNRLAEAEREFDSVPPANPAYWQAQYFSAVAKAQIGKSAAALTILTRVVAQFPNHSDAQFLLGMLLEDAREIAQAESCFRKVTTVSPQNARGWLALGRVLQQQAKGEEALAALVQAEKLSSDDPALPILLGGQYFRTAHYAQAVKYLQPAWKSDPGDLTLASQLASSYAILKDFAALEAMMGGIPEANLPDVEIAVGLALIAAGEESRGFTSLLKGSAARPEDFKSQRIVADAMFRSELYEDAARAYRECLALKPGDPETTLMLGRALYEDRRIADAREQYLEAVRLQPNSFAAWFHLGISNRALRKAEEARQSFLKALALDPKSAEVLYNLGMVALTNGETAEAADSFQKALALAPDHVGALYELGRLWITQEKLKEGLAKIDRAVQLSPSHTQAHYQRAMALRRLGRLEESKQEFDTFTRLEREDRERRKVVDRKLLTPAKPPE